MRCTLHTTHCMEACESVSTRQRNYVTHVLVTMLCGSALYARTYTSDYFHITNVGVYMHVQIDAIAEKATLKVK